MNFIIRKSSKLILLCLFALLSVNAPAQIKTQINNRAALAAKSANWVEGYASYLSGDKHNLYLSAGVTILGGGDEFSDYETGQFGTFAAGYHYQSDSGFYVRPIFSFLNVIDVDDDGSGLMWPGLCIGGSF